MNNWGMHPEFDYQAPLPSSFQGDDKEKHIFGEMVQLSDLRKISQEVFLVPRDRHLRIVDRIKRDVDLIRVNMPFCSHDLCMKDEQGGYLASIFDEQAFLRQQGISQLQNLTPPKKAGLADLNVHYSFPVFPHTRHDHAVMVAMMAMFMLNKKTLPWNEVISFVIAAAYHDSATVAGGDAVRSSFEELCEEMNFPEYLKNHGLDGKWKKKFNFKLDLARGWVRGKGKYGALLDAIDKISYTILDCFYLGKNVPAHIRCFVAQNPLFGDVWQDIGLDKNGFIYFADADRLWNFLMVRALMHVSLYKNPECRKIENLIAQKTRDIIRQGLISLDDLKREDDDWLSRILEKNGCSIRSYMSPDGIGYECFSRQDDCFRYASLLGEKKIAIERIKSFSVGLDWQVKKDGKFYSLEDLLSLEKTTQLKNLAISVEGWYVYFHK